MRKIVIAAVVTVAFVLAGAFAWKAQAASGVGPLGAPVQVSKPIHEAACYGYGPRCPPGTRYVCGPYGYRCWCAPC